jgi:TPR repeat protein
LQRIASASRLFICCLLWALAASASGAPDFVEPDYKATHGIVTLIEGGHCKSAVDALKPDLKSKQPDVLLLAGTMYQEGLCVPRNREKAATLYMLA